MSSRSFPIVLFVVIFILNPLAGILCASIYACDKNNNIGIIILTGLLMLYLSALNTTKVPENDMIRYLDMFYNVPTNGFWGTLSSFNHSAGGGVKDAAYGIFVYVLYYVTFGNQYLFIFIVTSIGYLFMFLTIFKFSKEYKFPNYLIVTQVLILSFFTQYFGLTFHLVRQVLASTIFFYALTFRNNSIKKYLFWSLLAAATHSSVVLLIAFSFIPYMQRRLRIAEIGALALFAAFSVAIISTFAEFVLDTVELEGSMEYTLNRAANMEGAQDSTAGFQLMGLIFTIATMALCFWERTMGSKMMYPIVINMGFVVTFMTLGLSASPLLQYRFFFYIYSFLPFIFPIFCRKIPGLEKPICLTTVIFLIIRFYATLNHVFEYVPPVEDALLLPYPLLIKLM